MLFPAHQSITAKPDYGVCWAETGAVPDSGAGSEHLSPWREMSPVKARTFPSIALSFGPGFFLKKKWSEMASFDGLFSNCCLFNQPKPQLWGRKMIRCFSYLLSVLIKTQSTLQQSPNSQSLPQTHNKLSKRPVTHTGLHDLLKSPSRLPGPTSTLHMLHEVRYTPQVSHTHTHTCVCSHWHTPTHILTHKHTRQHLSYTHFPQLIKPRNQSHRP